VEIIGWLILALFVCCFPLVAVLAVKKNRRVWLWLLLSLSFTPFVTMPLLLILKKRTEFAVNANSAEEQSSSQSSNTTVFHLLRDYFTVASSEKEREEIASEFWRQLRSIFQSYLQTPNRSQQQTLESPRTNDNGRSIDSITEPAHIGAIKTDVVSVPTRQNMGTNGSVVFYRCSCPECSNDESPYYIKCGSCDGWSLFVLEEEGARCSCGYLVTSSQSDCGTTAYRKDFYLDEEAACDVIREGKKRIGRTIGIVGVVIVACFLMMKQQGCFKSDCEIVRDHYCGKEDNKFAVESCKEWTLKAQLAEGDGLLGEVADEECSEHLRFLEIYNSL